VDSLLVISAPFVVAEIKAPAGIECSAVSAITVVTSAPMAQFDMVTLSASIVPEDGVPKTGVTKVGDVKVPVAFVNTSAEGVPNAWCS